MAKKAVAADELRGVKLLTNKPTLQDKPQHFAPYEIGLKPGYYKWGKDGEVISLSKLKQLKLDDGMFASNGMGIHNLDVYNFLLSNPKIAESRKKYSSQKHDWWINNPEEVAKVDLEDDEILFQAMKIIQDQDESGRYDLAIYLGIDYRSISPKQLMSALNKRAKRTDYSESSRSKGAHAIIEFGDPVRAKEVGEINFIRKLLHFRMLSKRKGRYFYNEIPLGYTEQEVFEELSNANREDLKLKLERDLIQAQNR